MLGPFLILSHLIFTALQRSCYYYYSYFTADETGSETSLLITLLVLCFHSTSSLAELTQSPILPLNLPECAAGTTIYLSISVVQLWMSIRITWEVVVGWREGGEGKLRGDSLQHMTHPFLGVCLEVPKFQP